MTRAFTRWIIDHSTHDIDPYVEYFSQKHQTHVHIKITLRYLVDLLDHKEVTESKYVDENFEAIREISRTKKN